MRSAFLISLVLVLIPACGGGGGGGAVATAESPIVGTYFVQRLEYDQGPAELHGALWGLFDTDGLGLVTGGTVQENSGGTIGAPTIISPLPFDLTGGLLRFSYPSLGGTYEGGIAPDGGAAILGSVTDGNRPGITVLGRTDDTGTSSTASIAGTYHLCAFFFGGTTETRTWFGGTATFNATGGVQIRTGLNDGSTLLQAADAPGLPFGTCSVDPDGATIWTTPSGPWEGGVTLGGELVTFSGYTNGGQQALIVLVRAGVALSTATFDGPYHYVALTMGGRASNSGTVNADGIGSVNFSEVTRNFGGVVVSRAVDVDVPYTVSPNGALSLTVDGTLLGGVSPSGRVAVAAGGTAERGGLPEARALYILLR